jgi:hypothetical protein
MAERGHGAAQSIRLVGREFGRGDGDLHRLLLEQRDAEGALENVFQFVLVAMRRMGRRIIRLFAIF